MDGSPVKASAVPRPGTYNRLNCDSSSGSVPTVASISLTKPAPEGLGRPATRSNALWSLAGFATFLLTAAELPPASLKKAMLCCSCSAWELISSEVAASSSELAALCWVV